MSASLKVEGLKELEAQLLALGPATAQKALTEAARKAMAPVLADAKAMVSADTGALRDSIKLATAKPKNGDTVVAAGLRIARTKVPEGTMPPSARWHFAEFGTSTQSAHPFLRPALDKNAQAVLDSLKVEIAKSIQRSLKRQAKGKK